MNKRRNGNCSIKFSFYNHLQKEMTFLPSNKTKTSNHHLCYFFLCQNSLAITPPQPPPPPPALPSPAHGVERDTVSTRGGSCNMPDDTQRPTGRAHARREAASLHVGVWVCAGGREWKTQRPPHHPLNENETTVLMARLHLLKIN